MNPQTSLILIQTVTTGLIEYILDAVALTTGQPMTLEERQQIHESLLTAIMMNVSSSLLDQPQISQKTATLATQLKPEMTFDQSMAILAQHITPVDEAIDINLPQMIAQQAQPVLIEFIEKTIPDAEKLTTVVKQILTEVSQ